ncbi:MAG TPA: regulatory iron-sulfur-containing complex subunit RicT, partial [Phycisphaerales bacterium]|nr:regulatory iron-sulfur-containing complex subunit RicT [Phycisphaerales bacterium]
MPIVPLPVFEKEADPATRSALSDEDLYARLAPPKSVVVKFGCMKMIGEFPYSGDAKPGCGSKLVVRTHRGTELAEMLTTTCSNSGCSKSVSRKEMLDYIENSGGREYPFHTNGRVLRVATIEDMNANSAMQTDKTRALRFAREHAGQLNPGMKIVDAEPILGGEVLTFYYMSEARVDFRELATKLADEFKTRIELWQVGARDEARLNADYEKCGQHCCCRNFLKVLKPVSMRQAKQQKGTLDPLKISGRCGRLMCCLRYEDATYQELKAKLPAKGTRVGTAEGVGVVIDTKILVQLALVRLEGGEGQEGGREIAVPIEELMKPEDAPKPAALTTEVPAPRTEKMRRNGRTGGGERQAERGRGDEGRRGRRDEGREAAKRDDRGDGDPLRGMNEEEVRRRMDREERGRGGSSRNRQGERGQGEDAGRGGPNDRQARFTERENR